MYNPGWRLLPHVHRQRIRVRRWHPLRRRDVAGQRVPDFRRSDQRRPTRMGTTRWWLWPCSHRLSQCFNTSQRPTKANANSFWITDLKNFANKLVLRCRPTQLWQSAATSKWHNVLQKKLFFKFHFSIYWGLLNCFSLPILYLKSVESRCGPLSQLWAPTP